MKKQDFYFDLPEELIASYPLSERSASRLLVYQRANDILEHKNFANLIDFLRPGDLLVFNNTKVMPARFYGFKESGGKVEFLVERILDEENFLALIRASKTPKPGSLIRIAADKFVEIVAKLADIYHCKISGRVEDILDELGQIPLPPYMNRPAEALDTERYQTIYAKHKGSVAAPTAGLHFDEKTLKALQEKQVELAYLTLHVGAGTFKPVRSDNIAEHKMHYEYCEIDETVASKVNSTRSNGGRVIAVGTTALRSLETAAVEGILEPYNGDTDIFITPGYKFKICDGLITNFHLPESTLIMLVSAFVGHAKTLELYQEAIALKYRFYSYGDASLFL